MYTGGTNFMSHVTELRIKPYNQIRLDHPCYIVPAFLENPVCETSAMQILRRELRLRRKTIERARISQLPGNVFHFGGTKNRTLVCVMLANSPEALTYKALRAFVPKAVQQTVEDTAVVGDGFRLPSNSKNKDDAHYGFELLCRVMRRLGFSGTVYEPPEYLQQQIMVDEFPDERITDTHMILRPDGSITPSIPPTMLRFRDSKPESK